MRRWLLGLATAGLLACDSGAGGDLYIALQSDFAPFESWKKIPLGNAPLAGHPAGNRAAYINKPVPAAGAKYPVGTIVIKTVEAGAAVTNWDLFGMTKRGGGFNSAGARDWEFFILKMTAERVPVILSHGFSPSDGDGGAYPGNMDAGGVTCNSCHGVLGTDRTDHLLTPALAPGAQ